MRRVPVQPPAATEDARPFSVNGRDSTKQRQRLHRAPEGRVRKSPPREPLARAAAPRIRRRSERPRRPRRGADSALRLGGHEGPVDPQALLRVTPGPPARPPSTAPQAPSPGVGQLFLGTRRGPPASWEKGANPCPAALEILTYPQATHRPRPAPTLALPPIATNPAILARSTHCGRPQDPGDILGIV